MDVFSTSYNIIGTSVPYNTLKRRDNEGCSSPLMLMHFGGL